MAKAPTKVKKKPSASKLKVQSASKPKEEVKLDPKTAEANKKQLELALAIPKVVSLKPGSKETISSSKLTQTKAADIKKQVLALAQTGKKNEGKVEKKSPKGKEEKVPKSTEDYAAEKNDKKESGGTKPCENGGKKKKKGDDENNDKSSDGKKTHKKSSVEEKKDVGKKTDEKSSDGKKTHKKSSGEDKTDDGKKTNKKSSGEEKKDDGNGKKTNKKSSAEEKKDDAVGSDPSTQPAARKGVLRNPGGKPAPKVDVTPPTKRVLIKSPDPSQTPSTTASEESLHAKKKREAEEALLTRKDLREACKKARLEADFDAAGIGSFLQNFADDPADPKCGQVLASKMASKLAEAPPQKMESEDEDEEESEDSSDGQEEEGMDTDEEEEEAEEECEGGEEGEECEGGEEEVDDADEEEEEEEEEKEGGDGDEKEKEAEGAEEDAEVASEEDECEGEEESAGEDDPCVEGHPVEESNGKKLAAAAARTEAVAKEVRNSTTHKREWDKFSKSAKTKAFPIELAPHFKKNKNSLFGMWLDCGQEWDKVTIAVKQEQEQSHLARSQWEAIQVKDLRSKLSEPKFDELLKKRTADGLVYQDRDFPDDPED